MRACTFSTTTERGSKISEDVQLGKNYGINVFCLSFYYYSIIIITTVALTIITINLV